MDESQVKQLVPRRMWVLGVMLLLGQQSNDMVGAIKEGRLDNLPFRLQASSSETTTCNPPIFWA